jgi:hypothetical protein
MSRPSAQSTYRHWPSGFTSFLKRKRSWSVSAWDGVGPGNSVPGDFVKSPVPIAKHPDQREWTEGRGGGVEGVV